MGRSIALGGMALLLASCGNGGTSGGAANAQDGQVSAPSAASSGGNWLIGEWKIDDTQCPDPGSFSLREVYTAETYARFNAANAYQPGWTSYKIWNYNVNPQYAWVQLGPSASETGKVYFIDENHIKEENQLGPTCVYVRTK